MLIDHSKFPFHVCPEWSYIQQLLRWFPLSCINDWNEGRSGRNKGPIVGSGKVECWYPGQGERGTVESILQQGGHTCSPWTVPDCAS